MSYAMHLGQIPVIIFFLNLFYLFSCFFLIVLLSFSNNKTYLLSFLFFYLFFADEIQLEKLRRKQEKERYVSISILYCSSLPLHPFFSPSHLYPPLSPLSPPLSHILTSMALEIKMVWERTGWDKLRLLFLASSVSPSSSYSSSPLSLLPKNVFRKIIQYLYILLCF